MKRNLKLLFALVPSLMLFSQGVIAQDSSAVYDNIVIKPVKTFTGVKGFNTFSIGINAGALAPIAAIGGSNDFTKWKPTLGYGAYIRNQFRHNFAVQAEFLKGIFKADNSKELGNGTDIQSPYSSFKTDLNWAASLSGMFTFGNVNWVSEKNALVPYISVGGGIASYKPTLVLKGSSESVNYSADGNSIKEFFVPVGGGIKIAAGSGLNIDLGYRINFIDADNLDGYYRTPGHKDKFSYGFAGLEFVFGNKTSPQLLIDNPAAQLKRDLQDENMALKNSVMASQQSMQSSLAQVTALQDELNKLKTDSDGDGVSDNFDKCPSTPADQKVDGSGCPLPKPEVVQQPPSTTHVIITEEDRRVVNDAIKNLEFDLGKSSLNARSYPSLDRVAEILISKNFSLKLAGHTDNIGSESSNMKLSKDRAESVKGYLVSKGANPSRIEATGYGESQPIASNKSAEGRQQNRRVEFTLY